MPSVWGMVECAQEAILSFMRRALRCGVKPTLTKVLSTRGDVLRIWPGSYRRLTMRAYAGGRRRMTEEEVNIILVMCLVLVAFIAGILIGSVR